jgi:hypothetical protein
MPQVRITSGVVYHAGGGTNKSMTPRPDKDLEGFRRGVPCHIDPEQIVSAGERPRKHRVFGIDVTLLNELQAFQDEDGHVSLRPRSDELLQEWADRREDEEQPHWLTNEVQDAIIDRQEIVT